MNSDKVSSQSDPAQVADEKDLIRRAQQGDVDAYDVLVRRFQGKIYALVYNMTSNKEDAEDRVQDVFIKAFHSLRHFKGESSFYTWLYRIAINRTINFLKTRKNRITLSLSDMDSGAERDPAYVELRARESPVRDVSLIELQDKLNKALQTLSEKHRVVVVMHDIQGVPHEEIARIMGCSQGTVRSRLFYARQQLQKELKDFAP
ncbi:MAG TPA: sigma-70 family RNA polymerase sigma factor [Kiritimatiellia bacterium]|nr:sigma-70 family RNA polymerase sigma factor [Kiritimatiellia bacterium]HRZ12716.1 sigma-70 family RNA polymerase sigma factor [Kiritimatiellia bacterium]HSA18332.1 sigma-70 family RNA polymerase sigma factor [Kiritimatiellia bacterium]